MESLLSNPTFKKAVAVMASCQTAAQVTLAERFADLALRQMLMGIYAQGDCAMMGHVRRDELAHDWDRFFPEMVYKARNGRPLPAFRGGAQRLRRLLNRKSRANQVEKSGEESNV